MAPRGYLRPCVCLACRRAFRRAGGLSWADRACSRCGGVAQAVGRNFKAPPTDDVGAWMVIRYLVERGFRYQTVTAGNARVPYPRTMRDARVFATRFAHRALQPQPAPPDGGKLAHSLHRIAPKAGSSMLSRAQSMALWDQFIDPEPRHRHFMLLPRTSWVIQAQAAATRITLGPPPPDLQAAGWWLVCWMRERAALCAAGDLAERAEALLREDDEGLIALATGTADLLLSVGGQGLWWRGVRPT